MSGWALGFTLGAVVVVAVVALVVPILLLAARIGRQAQAIDDSLQKSVQQAIEITTNSQEATARHSASTLSS